MVRKAEARVVCLQNRHNYKTCTAAIKDITQLKTTLRNRKVKGKAMVNKDHTSNDI